MSVTVHYSTALIEPAQAAGIPIPPDIDSYNHGEFRRWSIFCSIQLSRDMPEYSEWHNAIVVASLTENQLINITWDGLDKAGYKSLRNRWW